MLSKCQILWEQLWVFNLQRKISIIIKNIFNIYPTNKSEQSQNCYIRLKIRINITVLTSIIYNALPRHMTRFVLWVDQMPIWCLLQTFLSFMKITSFLALAVLKLNGHQAHWGAGTSSFQSWKVDLLRFKLSSYWLPGPR